MEKVLKSSFLLIFLLGLGLVYLGSQVHSLRERVDEVDYLVIDGRISIDNGTDVSTKTVHLTRGATALEALRRIATVETTVYPGSGEFITGINGLDENKASGRYWMIYRWSENEGNWSLLQVGASSYRLKNEDNIRFSYEKPSW